MSHHIAVSLHVMSHNEVLLQIKRSAEVLIEMNEETKVHVDLLSVVNILVGLVFSSLYFDSALNTRFNLSCSSEWSLIN